MVFLVFSCYFLVISSDDKRLITSEALPLNTFHHEWDGISYFVTKLDTNIQKSTFGKKVVALFYIIKVLNFMR